MSCISSVAASVVTGKGLMQAWADTFGHQGKKQRPEAVLEAFGWQIQELLKLGLCEKTIVGQLWKRIEHSKLVLVDHPQAAQSDVDGGL